jgi:hypothetical protein
MTEDVTWEGQSGSGEYDASLSLNQIIPHFFTFSNTYGTVWMTSHFNAVLEAMMSTADIKKTAQLCLSTTLSTAFATTSQRI